MCNLDISERRLPQDGRIVFKKYTKKNIDIDLRVATGPMNHGEKVVMRILDKQKSTLPLTALGFSDENLEKYRACIVLFYFNELSYEEISSVMKLSLSNTKILLFRGKKMLAELYRAEAHKKL